tara:strand:- start:223 stop:630 length:408 start_codon:yes stop_codon:yes gene_type:complete
MKLKSDVNKQTEHWGAKSLPKLSDYDTNVALSHENRTWAMNFSKLENIGKIHFMEGMGFTIQNSGNYNVRCICVVDHFECRIGLALMKETLHSIRVNFDLENMIVMPFIKPDENQETADEKQTSNPQEHIYFDVV